MNFVPESKLINFFFINMKRSQIGRKGLERRYFATNVIVEKRFM